MALVCLDSVKGFLGIRNNTEDTRLQGMIDYVSAAIKGELDREIEQATYTEYYSGDGTPVLWLRQRPVTSITTIHLDSGAYYGQASGAFGATTLLTAGTDYALVYDGTLGGAPVSFRGHVERIGRVWTMATNSRGWYPNWYENMSGRLSHEPPFPRAGNIKVVYVAGYTATTLPKEIELAASLWVGLLRRSAKFGGSQPQHERLGNYDYQLFSSAANGSGGEWGTIRQLLGKYKEVAI